MNAKWRACGYAVDRSANCAAIYEGEPDFRQPLEISGERICGCPATHLNCLTAKEWLKRQVGVWRFFAFV